MREVKVNTDDLGYKPSENGLLRTESSLAGTERAAPRPESHSPQPEKARGMARRSAVAYLLGSFLLMLAIVVTPMKSSASVGIFVSFGPPAIPVYVQPDCPAPGYIWTPGYWAWDPAYGYYWVPGTWVPAPFVGALWTPGYWGWQGSGYEWYPGYWGTVVGFYGGIDYGFGYTGHGYYGGYWNRGRFYYNREVNRITSRNITTVYSQRVVVNDRGPRISYNGGRGGIEARPTSGQMAATRTRRFGAINQQLEQERFARSNPAQRARENHGRPEVAATARPGEFKGNGAVRATRAGAPYNEPPREVRSGRQVQQAVPSQAPNRPRVESTPARNTPRQAQPNVRIERSAPAQPMNARPVNRNNTRATVQLNSHRTSAQPQVRRPESHAAPERPAPNSAPAKHDNGNGHAQRGGHR